MDKQGRIASEFYDGISCLRQMIFIIMHVRRLSLTTKMVVLVALKDATLEIMGDMMSRKKNANEEKRKQCQNSRKIFTDPMNKLLLSLA